MDEFNTSIHENKALSNIEKFNYLRNFLTDSAYLLISALSLNSENYKDTVNDLKERFDNKQTLIFSNMDSFVQLPVVENSNDVINLRKINEKVEIIVRNLDSLDVKNDNFNLLI